MTMQTSIRVAMLGILVLAVSACSIAPSYNKPNLPVPQNVGLLDVAPDAIYISWNEFFKDPRLKSLIAISLKHNKDLRIAALNVAEARAQYGVQFAGRLPSLGVEGSNKYSGTLDDNTISESYNATAAISFELDFFGRVKNLSESAFQNYMATEEAEKTAKIALIAGIAQGHLAVSLASELLQLAEETQKSWQTSFLFIEQRLQSGQSSLQDLEQARGMVEMASIDVAMRKRELIKANNALMLLLGSFDEQTLPPVLPLAEQEVASLPQGISSNVLLGRPDVMAAEHKLLMAHADIGVARAAFFPSISLTGNLGYMSNDLSTLFTSGSPVWSFMPKISLPIFTGGRNKTNLKLANVRKERSIVQYEKTIQTAFREVVDTLQTSETFAEQYAAQERYLATQELVLALATNKYLSGSISYLEVLSSQRSMFEAKQNVLNIRRDRLANAISLYIALGGGFIAKPNNVQP